mmetsp:Transcript_44095/g.132197  ORF Transcript_44095/g.132197 Transcript_44095/m.132197 type:complete len:212 (+) Transcript_44095:474-1109(+)
MATTPLTGRCRLQLWETRMRCTSGKPRARAFRPARRSSTRLVAPPARSPTRPLPPRVGQGLALAPPLAMLWPRCLYHQASARRRRLCRRCCSSSICSGTVQPRLAACRLPRHPLWALGVAAAARTARGLSSLQRRRAEARGSRGAAGSTSAASAREATSHRTACVRYGPTCRCSHRCRATRAQPTHRQHRARLPPSCRTLRCSEAAPRLYG